MATLSSLQVGKHVYKGLKWLSLFERKIVGYFSAELEGIIDNLIIDEQLSEMAAM